MKKIIFILLIKIMVCSAIYCKAEQPYVILVSLDGFRWDYANRGLTPNLDYIKQNGVSALSFKPAYPSFTFPNHQAIITGMYPQNHGIIANFFENIFTGELYSIRDTNAVRNPEWYWGEAFWETAKRYNIKTASYFWPGSELIAEYRRPDYYEKYEHLKPYDIRVNGIIQWLQLPFEQRPKFLTLYFDDTDTRGHIYGTDSKEINEAIRNVDNYLGLLIEKLSEINMLDSINLIVLSDHGMTNTDSKRVIYLDSLLTGLSYKTQGNGPLISIEPNSEDFDTIYSILKHNEKHYKVYHKNDSPKHLNIADHPYLYSLLIVADVGWLVLTGNSDYFLKSKAQHGFDNSHTDMHGIFFAMGPAFKKQYSTGTLNVIDVYPLLCKIFKIQPRSNIDGKLENIGFILK